MLALDPGERVVGVAVTDESRIVITPLPPVVRRGGLALGAFRRLFAAQKPSVIVMGRALREDGTLSESGRTHKAFAAKLQKHFAEYAFTWADERFSTQAAREGRPEITKNNEAENLDSLAAAEILHTWLEHQRDLAAREKHSSP